MTLGLLSGCSSDTNSPVAEQGATTAATDVSAAQPTSAAVEPDPVATEPVSTTTDTAPSDTQANGEANTDTSVADTVAATDAATSADGTTSITVDGTSASQYFVLYVRPVLEAELELPVAIARGDDGSTTLTDGRRQLPTAHYRVATFDIGNPGDVDADGVDDLTELADPANANPLNPAAPLDRETGAVVIPDQATFETLSYQGDEVARDGYLAGQEFVKFWIVDSDTDRPTVYFMNTETYRAHPMFARAIGLEGGRGPAPGKMRGDIVYAPDATAPDGTKGRYRFAFQPSDAYSFAEIALAYEVLSTSMPAQPVADGSHEG